MKKLVRFITIIVLLFGVLAACGTGNEQSKGQENQQKVDKTEQPKQAADLFPVTIKDSAGKDVVIEKKPEKIVSLIPSNTEILFALDEGNAVVGVSESDNYPEEVKDIDQVAGMELNVEKILSLQPDLVLAHGSTASMWESGLSQLEESGVPVLIVNDAQSFEETYQSIQMIGQATGKKAEANELVEEMKAKLTELENKADSIKEADQKTVFVEISSEPEIFATGKNTFMNEMLEAIHAKNAVTEDGWLQFNEEAVVKLNPDVILVTYTGENAVDQVLARKAWKDVTAIKEKQVYQVNEDLVSRPGPRIVEGVEELAKAIYPEVFAE